jgi:hypothetical protein
MATRFNSRSVTNYDVPGLETAVGGPESPLFVPPCGIEDVDKSLFTLFDKEIPFSVDAGDGKKPVPIIFAAGEKWALNKRRRAIRDKMNTLILPLITIVRTEINQDPAMDVTGRGINQQTGELTIMRKLDRSDRNYQRLINKLYLKNQQDLAVKPSDEHDEQQLVTGRTIGSLSTDPTVEIGGLMIADRRNNIYETLTIPVPRFFTAVYEVTMWAQYIQQMNQMLEIAVNSLLPQGLAWKLETLKGYWFLATVENGAFTSENNFDTLSEQERILKHKFTIKVPAYTLAGPDPTAPVPVKRYVSCPFVSFDTSVRDVGEDKQQATVDDPFLGADDPTLPLDAEKNSRRDRRRTNRGRVYVGPSEEEVDPHDPALQSYPRGRRPRRWRKIVTKDQHGNERVQYARIKSVNKAGEVVVSDVVDLGGLEVVVVDS